MNVKHNKLQFSVKQKLNYERFTVKCCTGEIDALCDVTVNDESES